MKSIPPMLSSSLTNSRPLPRGFPFNTSALSSVPFHSMPARIITSMNFSLWLLATCSTFYVERNTLLELQSTSTSRYGKASQDSSSLPWSTGIKSRPDFFTRSRTILTNAPYLAPSRVFAWVPSATRIRSLIRNHCHMCIHILNSHQAVDFEATNGTRQNNDLWRTRHCVVRVRSWSHLDLVSRVPRRSLRRSSFQPI